LIRRFSRERGEKRGVTVYTSSFSGGEGGSSAEASAVVGGGGGRKNFESRGRRFVPVSSALLFVDRGGKKATISFQRRSVETII